MADLRTVDIIIPTYRPGERFIRLLSMLEKQTYPYHRLIVVNTGEDLMPDSVKRALTEGMDRAVPYCDLKGMPAAREAIERLFPKALD